ncbi:MAG: glycosyltransferase family 2 protein [bacterium]
MRCPALSEVPPPPPGKMGWPWTEESQQLPDRMPGPSTALRASGEPWPKVSIVTPSYNQGQFIEETIRSVLLQGYPNLEYIIIDGGSTDGSVDVIRKYEPWLAYWVSEPDEGQADAINKGFARARGEIMAWLNSDDTYLPTAIQSQVAALRSRKDCGFVYGDVLYVDEDGELIYKGYGRPYSVLDLLRLSIPAQPTTFMRRDMYEEIGPLNARFHYSMDSEYWARAAKVTDFLYNPKSIATYRLHGASKTVGQHAGFHEDWIAIARSFFSDANGPRVSEEQQSQILADIHNRIAAMEAARGTPSEAWRHLLEARRIGGLRVRMVKTLPILLDRFLHLNMTPKLTQLWTHLRSKSSRS